MDIDDVLSHQELPENSKTTWQEIRDDCHKLLEQLVNKIEKYASLGGRKKQGELEAVCRLENIPVGQGRRKAIHREAFTEHQCTRCLSQHFAHVGLLLRVFEMLLYIQYGLERLIPP